MLEYNCTEDLLLSLAVCWKRTLAEGCLYFLSVDRVCLENEMVRETDANETVGELG